jgi:hypothetical protein
MSMMGGRGRGGRGGRGTGGSSAPITFDDDGNAVTGATADGPPPLFPPLRRAPPPPPDLSPRDEALLKYRRALQSAWRNSCYFLDKEPAQKKYPEMIFVRYADRDARTKGSANAESVTSSFAEMTERNARWFPEELLRPPRWGDRAHRERGNTKRRRHDVNDDDDPNVNDPNVTIWSGTFQGGSRARGVSVKPSAAGDISRLDKLARLEEADGDRGGAGDSRNDKGRSTKHEKPKRESNAGDDDLDDDREAKVDDREREPAGDVPNPDVLGSRRDERLRKKHASNEEDDEDDEEGVADEDDWDDEDDYQQGGNFDDDDGYDDDFQDDGEGDAFF